ncbi:MAG: hypothetical protein RMH97_05665 [Verrucomicrobiales bacterium]|nr:hypothetical protein [Verrucomicrobiales bacterium]
MKTIKNLLVCAVISAFTLSAFAAETEQPKDKSACKEKAACCAEAKKACCADKGTACAAKKDACCKKAKSEKPGKPGDAQKPSAPTN